MLSCQQKTLLAWRTALSGQNRVKLDRKRTLIPIKGYLRLIQSPPRPTQISLRQMQDPLRPTEALLCRKRSLSDPARKRVLSDRQKTTKRWLLRPIEVALRSSRILSGQHKTSSQTWSSKISKGPSQANTGCSQAITGSSQVDRWLSQASTVPYQADRGLSQTYGGPYRHIFFSNPTSQFFSIWRF